MIQMGEVADIVGNLPIYDTIYKENRYSPWKYAGQCYPGGYRIEIRHSCRCAISAADTGQIPERNWKKISKWRSGQQAR